MTLQRGACGQSSCHFGDLLNCSTLVGFKVRAVTNYLQLSKLQASFAMSELLSDGETFGRRTQGDDQARTVNDSIGHPGCPSTDRIDHRRSLTPQRRIPQDTRPLERRIAEEDPSRLESVILAPKTKRSWSRAWACVVLRGNSNGAALVSRLLVSIPVSTP